MIVLAPGVKPAQPKSEPLDAILVDALDRIHAYILRGDRRNNDGLLATLDAIQHTAMWAGQEFRAQFEEPIRDEDIPF